MAIPLMNEDVEIIQKLNDLPNQEDGLSAEQMKQRFDAAAVLIKAYLNGTLVPAVQQLQKALSNGDVIGLDETLSVAGQAADAAATGAALARRLPAAESADHPGCYYRMVEGEKEWVNPPMQIGVEYRTTERWQHKPLYTKMVDFGTLPNSTIKTLNVGVHTTNIFRMELRASNGSETFNEIGCAAYGGSLFFYENTICIRTHTDMSVFSGVITIWYTKG